MALGGSDVLVTDVGAFRHGLGDYVGDGKVGETLACTPDATLQKKHHGDQKSTEIRMQSFTAGIQFIIVAGVESTSKVPLSMTGTTSVGPAKRSMRILTTILLLSSQPRCGSRTLVGFEVR